MARFEVVRRDGHGRPRGTFVAQGLEPYDALLAAQSRFPARVEPVTYDVYRVRRLRRRRYMVTYVDGSGDGLAGVREPRRPHPDLPGLEADINGLLVVCDTGHKGGARAVFANGRALRQYDSPLVNLQVENVLNLSKDFGVYKYGAVADEIPSAVVPVKVPTGD